jgi:hypothetical protein
MEKAMGAPVDEAALAVLLPDGGDPDLFVGTAPSSLALRLYAEGALSPEDAARVEGALRDPLQARRLARIVEDAEAREAALLRALTAADSREDTVVVVVLRSRATPMKRLCEPRELSIAASAQPGGVVQTSDREDLVTLKVAERFEPDAEDGEIEVEVCTFDDPRLVAPLARLEVVALGKVVREYRFRLTNRRFEGRFGIHRLPHASDDIEFHLYLSIAS